VDESNRLAGDGAIREDARDRGTPRTATRATGFTTSPAISQQMLRMSVGFPVDR
jgi:hypothetical protein